MLFDGLDGSFRQIRIRQKRADCRVCGPKPEVNPAEFDYAAFCGTPACDQTQQLKLLHELERVSVEDYKRILDGQQPHLLIDVRPANDYRIVHLPQSVSIPLAKLQAAEGTAQFLQLVDALKAKLDAQSDAGDQPAPIEVYMMCRLGNASQRAVHFLKQHLSLDARIELKDVEGGITAWSKRVDPSVPTY